MWIQTKQGVSVFRFYFNNDEVEFISNTFYFSTDKFWLQLKGQELIFATTIDELIEQIPEGPNKERDSIIIKKAFKHQERQFINWLVDVREAIKRFIVWEQKTSSTRPFGPGYVFNPSDPKRGKKNNMPEKSGKA